jgi:hypothetical protein
VSEPVYLRNCDIVFREIDEEMLLVPVRGSIVDLQGLFTLNASAALIWQRLGHPCTTGELARALVEEFEVEEEQAQADVRSFLDLLVAEGCVRRADEEPP